MFCNLSYLRYPYGPISKAQVPLHRHKTRNKFFLTHIILNKISIIINIKWPVLQLCTFDEKQLILWGKNRLAEFWWKKKVFIAVIYFYFFTYFFINVLFIVLLLYIFFFFIFVAAFLYVLLL